MVVTFISPEVSVPVLSKTIVVIFLHISKNEPLLMRIPCLAAGPIAASTADGVARRSAHGQATIRTVIPRTISFVTNAVPKAMTRIRGV